MMGMLVLSIYLQNVSAERRINCKDSYDNCLTFNSSSDSFKVSLALQVCVSERAVAISLNYSLMFMETCR